MLNITDCICAVWCLYYLSIIRHTQSSLDQNAESTFQRNWTSTAAAGEDSPQGTHLRCRLHERSFDQPVCGTPGHQSFKQRLLRHGTVQHKCHFQISEFICDHFKTNMSFLIICSSIHVWSSRVTTCIEMSSALTEILSRHRRLARCSARWASVLHDRSTPYLLVQPFATGFLPKRT